jgi:hypothetical protein
MALRAEPVAPRIGGPDRRTMLQAAGFTLAIAATLAVFLTENPQILRLAVVGVAWGVRPRHLRRRPPIRRPRRRAGA